MIKHTTKAYLLLTGGTDVGQRQEDGEDAKTDDELAHGDHLQDRVQI